METTHNLGLLLLHYGQLNKDITVNESLNKIDAMLNTALESLEEFVLPPADLQDQALILVAQNGEESFEGQGGNIAFYSNGWNFITPKEGLLMWLKKEKCLAIFNGKKFIALNFEGAGNLTPSVSSDLEERVAKLEEMIGEKVALNVKSLGVNAKAEGANKLAVCSNYNLFTTENGDVRFVLNKQDAGSTASFVFQTAWNGMAEFGLVGGGNFILKVSTDGANWKEVFEVEKETGKINFKNDVLKNGVKIF